MDWTGILMRNFIGILMIVLNLDGGKKISISYRAHIDDGGVLIDGVKIRENFFRHDDFVNAKEIVFH